MNNITRSIFRAIHEGRWLSIEYKNQQTQQTKYWVAIRGLNPRTRTLNVDGHYHSFWAERKLPCGM